MGWVSVYYCVNLQAKVTTRVCDVRHDKRRTPIHPWECATGDRVPPIARRQPTNQNTVPSKLVSPKAFNKLLINDFHHDSHVEEPVYLRVWLSNQTQLCFNVIQHSKVGNLPPPRWRVILGCKQMPELTPKACNLPAKLLYWKNNSHSRQAFVNVRRRVVNAVRFKSMRLANKP